MDDRNPLQKACHVLQDHWQHIAQHASQLHGHLGSHLQRIRATSTKGERSEQNSAHFRRRLASPSKASLTFTLRLLVQSIQLHVCCRKPAFASISMAEDFPSRGRGGADIDPDASQGDDRGDKSSKKRRKQQKRAEKFRLELEQLSSEERAALARNAAVHGDIARDVGFAGRKVSFNVSNCTVDVCQPCNCSLGWLGEPIAMSLTLVGCEALLRYRLGCCDACSCVACASMTLTHTKSSLIAKHLWETVTVNSRFLNCS